MVALFALWALAVAPAHAQEVEVQYGGFVQADIRFAIPPKDRFPLPWYAPQPDVGPGIARDELRSRHKLYAKVGHFAFKGEIDLVLPGYTVDMGELDDLSRRWKVGPIFFEANQLYLEAYDLLPGLDVRVGNQVIDWGAADRFNPTNTVNPNDVEDVLLFGEQVGNLMARADYTPVWWLTLTGIYVPVFRPALLPATAIYGIAGTDRLPWYDDDLRLRVHAENAAASQIFGYPTVVSGTEVVLPQVAPRNGQFAFRLGALAGPVDVALSYYYGFSDTPVSVANHTTQTEDPRCTPFGECIDGTLDSVITLEFPKMQVIGLNLSADAFVGIRFEAGLFIPERKRIEITNGTLQLGPINRPAGEYPYPDGLPPLVVDGRPFAKWTLGVDYTFSKHVYLNAMWVHGFPGEFGAGDWISEGWTVLKGGVDSEPPATISCALGEDGTECAVETLHPRIGDYVIAGLDFHLLPAQAMLLRLFGIVDLSGGKYTSWSEEAGARVEERLGAFDPEVFSAVLYPEVQYNFGNGLELSGGVLLQIGRPHTVFGHPQTGGSMVFTRARFSY